MPWVPEFLWACFKILKCQWYFFPLTLRKKDLIRMTRWQGMSAERMLSVRDIRRTWGEWNDQSPWEHRSLKSRNPRHNLCLTVLQWWYILDMGPFTPTEAFLRNLIQTSLGEHGTRCTLSHPHGTLYPSQGSGPWNLTQLWSFPSTAKKAGCQKTIFHKSLRVLLLSFVSWD